MDQGPAARSHYAADPGNPGAPRRLSGRRRHQTGGRAITTRRHTNLGILATVAAALAPAATVAQQQQPIELPPPRPEFGTSLAQALKLRRSTREFAPRPLPPQVLSELLWSAYGVNRPATADRTAPSWRHARETEIFTAMADGVWRYDPIAHRLLPHLAADIRAQTGVQDFVGTAPLDLVFVADAEHLGGVAGTEQHRVAGADTGFIGQNVYLYCASEGLACVFRGSLDTDRLARTLRLPETQFVTFAQTVGYPKA
jgi:nitroreductase